jgi:hypothetical protein
MFCAFNQHHRQLTTLACLPTHTLSFLTMDFKKIHNRFDSDKLKFWHQYDGPFLIGGISSQSQMTPPSVPTMTVRVIKSVVLLSTHCGHLYHQMSH